MPDQLYELHCRAYELKDLDAAVVVVLLSGFVIVELIGDAQKDKSRIHAIDDSLLGASRIVGVTFLK